ncbi:MAG: hypothetical protein GF400_08065 [Candidatus Eisenbacteria bacterium]|nr:hypothetical protein [Candidatus Eisenbacteria bacterium]
MTEKTAARLLLLGAGVLVLACGCAGTGEEHPADASPLEESLPPARQPGYRLRQGDLIEVRFHADPGSDVRTPVSPAGTVSVPMAGELEAEGKTVGELSAVVTDEMARYLVDPRTSVVLVEIASQPVFVIGEVNAPKRVDARGALSVSMALAEAGGVKPTGKASSVMVVRTYGVEEPVAFKVDVTKVWSGRDLSEDIGLRGNDVVYVPKSVIGQVGEFVELFFTNIAPAQLFYLRGYDMINLEGAQWWRFQ